MVVVKVFLFIRDEEFDTVDTLWSYLAVQLVIYVTSPVTTAVASSLFASVLFCHSVVLSVSCFVYLISSFQWLLARLTWTFTYSYLHFTNLVHTKITKTCLVVMGDTIGLTNGEVKELCQEPDTDTKVSFRLL